jgi:ferredoxin
MMMRRAGPAARRAAGPAGLRHRAAAPAVRCSAAAGGAAEPRNPRIDEKRDLHAEIAQMSKDEKRAPRPENVTGAFFVDRCGRRAHQPAAFRARVLLPPAPPGPQTPGAAPPTSLPNPPNIAHPNRKPAARTCIDCQTCRWIAPATFTAVGVQAAVTKQPETKEQRVAALQALLSCPV